MVWNSAFQKYNKDGKRRYLKEKNEVLRQSLKLSVSKVDFRVV